MSLRHFAAPRLRHSLLVTSLLLAGSFSAHAAEEMLRKAVGKGAYEMAYSQQGECAVGRHITESFAGQRRGGLPS